MRPLLNSALVVSLLCASSVAQITQTSLSKSGKVPAQKPGAGREITPQQEQAVSTLNNLFERTKEFADDRTRIETQAQIADALWEYDRQSARRQFTEAFRSIEQIEDEERPLPFFNTPKTFLRIGLLRLIAKRDADLAERVIKDVPKTPTKNDQSLPMENRNVRGNLYLTLANELISTDPKRAANLIPKGFNSGFGMELIGALKFLGRKESEAADKLLRQALSEIQPNPDAPMADLFAIAQYFIPDSERAANHNANEQKEGISTATELIKPILVEPLLNFAFKAVTIESANEQKLMTEQQRRKRMVMLDMIDAGIVAWLLPIFEKYQPEKATFIRSHLGQIENTIPPSIHESINTPSPTTVQGLLDAARAKSKAFEKDMLYADAARKAEEAGDFDQAIAITEKLSDKRMGMDVELIRHNAVIHTTGKGDIDAAYRYAKALNDPFDQVSALCRIALKGFEKKDLQRANELIEEADNKIAGSVPTPKKVIALLGIADTVTEMDAASGFGAVNTAIKVINQIYASKTAPGNIGSKSPIELSRIDSIKDSKNFDKNLGALARTDFQRALRLALAITESDVSTLAQLSVCRGALTEPEIQRDESGNEGKNPERKSKR